MDILSFAVIWGLVGAIYAGLFVIFQESLIAAGYADYAPLIAAPLAGAIGAAFYGAMQVAILGTLAGILATFGYVVSMAEESAFLGVLAAAGLAGMVIGSGFGNLQLFLVRGALCKAMAGMIGGLAASAAVWGLVLGLGPRLPLWLETGLLVPITGSVYVALVTHIEPRLVGKVPVPIMGGLVAGSLASVIGTTFWAVGGAATGSVDPVVIQAMETALTRLPQAILGGALGGILAGAVLAGLGRMPGG